MSSEFPQGTADRDRWILAHRGSRNAVDPYRPHAFFVEEEPSENGEISRIATVFLTNRECSWRCTMCDLWRNTTVERTPPGAIPEQIEWALAQISEPLRQIKLYNSGSFFAPQAIPPQDYLAIASAVQPFERVIVENHPALTGEPCLRFRDLLAGCFEIAMGLETVHPGALEKLNKRLNLDRFQSAAEFLRQNGIALRVFILVQPPFIAAEESLYWAERTLDFAFDCGATAATLIPTRAGNGAMEALAANGEFIPPTLEVLEAALEYGLCLKRGRVFADTWDLPRAIDCSFCGPLRAERLKAMNLSQKILPGVPCQGCGGRG